MAAKSKRRKPAKSKSAKKPARASKAKRPAKPAKKPAPQTPAHKQAAPRTSALKPAASSKTPVAPPPIKKSFIDKSKGKRPITLHHVQMTKKQQQEMRALLVKHRASLAGDVDAMESEVFTDETKSISGNHMADSSADQYDQDFTLHMIENETGELHAIQRAIDKLDGKGETSYGQCEACSVWIAIERLRARPESRICMQCLEKFEQQGGGEAFGVLPETKY